MSAATHRAGTSTGDAHAPVHHAGSPPWPPSATHATKRSLVKWMQTRCSNEFLGQHRLTGCSAAVANARSAAEVRGAYARAVADGAATWPPRLFYRAREGLGAAALQGVAAEADLLELALTAAGWIRCSGSEQAAELTLECQRTHTLDLAPPMHSARAADGWRHKEEYALAITAYTESLGGEPPSAVCVLHVSHAEQT